MDWWMIALLGVCAVGGNFFMIWLFKKAKQQEARLQALAQQKGWSYEKDPATSRNAGYTQLADRAAGWTLRFYTGGDGSTGSATLWTDRTLAIPDGLAVYAAPLPEKTQAMMNVMMDKAGGLGRIMLDSIFKGLGPKARDLRAIEDDDPATLMASPGAETAFDPLKGADELMLLNQFGSNMADVPFLVRNADGLSMRINKRLSRPEDIEKFVDVAQTLAAKLRG